MHFPYLFAAGLDGIRDFSDSPHIVVGFSILDLSYTLCGSAGATAGCFNIIFV
jgi:hypothetical protein